jgi:hypothetical protein
MFPILKKGVWKCEFPRFPVLEFPILMYITAGAAVETNYVILNAKYNYVKTVDRDPGSVQFYKTCIEKGRAKGGRATGGKTTKGKTV